ncbi:hypothetical protein JXA85_07910 [Candidatus Woesearchaeota archaeon]|nr:hypothetical protein [Candidatus Woesearchaeota archaeon]
MKQLFLFVVMVLLIMMFAPITMSTMIAAEPSLVLAISNDENAQITEVLGLANNDNIEENMSVVANFTEVNADEPGSVKEVTISDANESNSDLTVEKAQYAAANKGSTYAIASNVADSLLGFETANKAVMTSVANNLKIIGTVLESTTNSA